MLSDCWTGAVGAMIPPRQSPSGASGRFFPDKFLGWRCACVAGGKECYEDALAGRSAPAAGARFEELMFAPMKAWARKHGADPADYPHEPRSGFQTFANEEGWS